MNAKQSILEQLKTEILSLQCKPGTIISETSLAERFQLSRTPIRDILKQLSLENYIDIYPKKGNIVSYIDLESVEQIIYLRSALEKNILKDLSGKLSLRGLHELKAILASQKECIDQNAGLEDFLHLDDAFHKTLFDLAGRLFLWEIIQQFNVHYVRYRKLHMMKKDKFTEILGEHERIVACLAQDQLEQIEDLLHHHLRADINSMYFSENYSEYIKR